MRRGTAVAACAMYCSKAFDKCKFNTLFSTLLEKQLPAIIIRALMFFYEEQLGWVRIGGGEEFK